MFNQSSDSDSTGSNDVLNIPDKQLFEEYFFDATADGRSQNSRVGFLTVRNVFLMGLQCQKLAGF